MLRWIVLPALLILASARPPQSQEDEHPIDTSHDCPEHRLSYFVTVRVEPLISAAHVTDDVDDSKCREWCTQNKNPSGKSFNCISYSYNDETRRCKLYSERTYPDGTLERKVTAKPKRFFEKYCMSESLAKDCARVDFMRVDEMLLSGFAQSTAIFRTMSECMNHCIEEKEFKCKSAMYFYEEGECITNVDTINHNNTLIHVEDDDRVVFLQNDCVMKKENKEPKTSIKPDAKVEKTVKTTSTTPQSTTTTSTTPRPTTTTSTITETSTTEASSPSTTIKTANLIERIVNEEVVETSTKTSSTIEMPRAERPVAETLETKRVEVGFLSSVEHGETGETGGGGEETKQQLYGAKILNPEAKERLTSHTESVLETLPDSSLSKPFKQSAPESAKIIKTNNALNEFSLSVPPSDTPSIVKEEDKYFTAWSNWSPCSDVGERRIRRRKCLDLKKCKGSLMQNEYCPPEFIIPIESVEEDQPENDAFARGPIGPVRQPLPVAKADEGAFGSPPSILPPQLPRKEVEKLPEGAPAPPDPTAVWSDWLGVCQQFASTQPCKNNQAIGFESRECIAKDPTQCKGPFFRYCVHEC